MAANVAATRELERAEENHEGSPIPTLERVLRRGPSSSGRADHKDGWPSISQLMNPQKNFSKICLAYKTMAVFFKKKFLPH
jgi:hypothetical protein